MDRQIGLLDTVAVVVERPELGLAVGEVGAVVEILGDGEAFEVEFCTGEGRTYGLHSLMADQIIALHNQGRPLHSASDRTGSTALPTCPTP